MVIYLNKICNICLNVYMFALGEIKMCDKRMPVGEYLCNSDIQLIMTTILHILYYSNSVKLVLYHYIDISLKHSIIIYFHLCL